MSGAAWGSFFGFALWAVACFVTGAGFLSVLNPVTAGILIAGTVGTAILSRSWSEVLQGFSRIWPCYFPTVSADSITKESMEQMLSFCDQARKEGLLAMEKDREKLRLPLFKRGASLVLEGRAENEVREMIESTRKRELQTELKVAQFFDFLAGSASTMGLMLGILYFVGILPELSHLEDPKLMVAGISKTFIAVFQGLVLSHGVFFPLASRVRENAAKKESDLGLIAEILQGLQQGASRAMIAQKISLHQ